MFRKHIGMLTLAMLLLLPGSSLGAGADGAKDISGIMLPELLEMVENAKGKTVLINFFATWCPPCREEIPELIAMRKDLPEDELLIIGLSVDEDMDALRAYAREVGFNYPVRTAGMDVVRWAGVSAIPHLVIFDKQGELQLNEPGLVPAEILKDFLRELMEQ